MIATVMADDCPMDCPDDRHDSSFAHRQYRSDGQRNNSLESWFGKCYRKTHEKRQEAVFYMSNFLSIEATLKMAKVELRGCVVCNIRIKNHNLLHFQTEWISWRNKCRK